MPHFISAPEFWVAVGFVVLVVAIARPAGRALGGMLDGRIQRIRDSLDDANRLREEAQHLLAEYQRKQRDAVRETQEMVEHAMEECDRLSAEAATNLEQALERRAQAALDKIAQAEAHAIADVRAITIDIAVSAARRLLEEGMSAAKAKELADDAIAELPGKLH